MSSSSWATNQFPDIDAPLAVPGSRGLGPLARTERVEPS
jgi:hypothetical protein